MIALFEVVLRSQINAFCIVVLRSQINAFCTVVLRIYELPTISSTWTVEACSSSGSLIATKRVAKVVLYDGSL